MVANIPLDSQCDEIASRHGIEAPPRDTCLPLPQRTAPETRLMRLRREAITGKCDRRVRKSRIDRAGLFEKVRVARQNILRDVVRILYIGKTYDARIG